jgi:hypothetical protein
MASVSKTRTLISETKNLASLPQPFSEYYPYYVLIQETKSTLEDFLISERRYVESMKISYGKPVKKPVNSSVFLPRLEDATVESKLCEHFCQFLHILMGNVRDSGDRSKIVGFDFITLDKIVKHHEFDSKDGYLGSGRIHEFWLKAKKCLRLNAESGHIDLDFMDLLSAFCGYTSFEYFLLSKFGKSYNSKKDKLLLGLIERHPLTTADKDVQPQPKEKKPRELVPNAITEPLAAYFMGREDDLILITDKLQRHRTLVIQSEGGMGKTTLAAAYYHQSINNKCYKTVAWLFCEQGTLKAIYDLAYVLGVNLQGVAETDRLLMIQHRLKEMEEDFLLVLDNVGDDLTDFIATFQGYRWNVLVTTRGRMDWEGIIEFELPALSTLAAKALFKVHYQNRSGEPLESGEEFEELLDKLISAIGQNTLVIEVFAKQLRAEFNGEKDERFGLKEFLLRLEQQGLYLEESQETVRTNYAFYRRKNEVATATEILDILYDFSKLDKKLKSLLINVALLPADSHKLPMLEELFQPEKKSFLRTNLKKLYASGWLGGDGSTQFRISPVIQELAIKKHQETLWEEGKGLVERVTSLIRYEPDEDNIHTKFKWKSIAERIVRHFADCQAEEYNLFLNELVTLLIHIGGRENLLLAATELEKTLALELEIYLEDSPSVAVLRSNLALALMDLGGVENLRRAVLELEKALASDLKNYLEDSPSVTTCRSNLALALRDLGGVENLSRAASELENALASYLKNDEEDSILIATYRSNLALVLKDLGGVNNLRRAVLELENALAWGLKNHGEDSPLVAKCRSNLAGVLMDLGGTENLHRAASELEKALESDLNKNDVDSIFVATSRSNLALVRKGLGGVENLRHAVSELEDVLALCLKNDGENSHSVATCRSNLAVTLLDLGGVENLKRAKTELENALASDLKNYGEHSPSIAMYRSILALVLRNLGGQENLLRAESELENALASDLKNYGEDSPDVAKCRSNLALVLKELGGIENLLRAAGELENALASNLKNNNEDLPFVVNIRSNLAMVLMDLGGVENLGRAKLELERALTSGLNNQGEESQFVATCRSNLAMLLRNLGGFENLQLAAAELEKAIALSRKNFGENSPQTVIPRLNLATIFLDLQAKDYLVAAQSLLLTSLPIALHHYGEVHSITLSVKSWLEAVEDLLNKD